MRRAAGATMRALALALCLAPLAGGRAGAEEPKAAPFEYVRDAADFDHVARLLSSREGFDAVLVAFDAISFAHPPGTSEYSAGHRYSNDFKGWTAALTAASAKRPFYAATSRSGKPVKVGEPNWDATLWSEITAKWWDVKKPEPFEPAARWMPRQLAAVPGKRKLIALVAGILTPEEWVVGDSTSPESRWRRALAPIGAYFDEEAVGDAVAAKGGVLWIVAPEARFGDASPAEELPQAPWASRPALPYDIPDLPAKDGPPDDWSKEDLETHAKKLRGQGLSEPEVQRLLKSLEPHSTLQYPRYRDTGRFDSSMPRFQRPWELNDLFNTCCPSGFGCWPYARAAAKTGGAYVFYPSPPSNWGDACPRDPTLQDELAPELVTAAQFVKLRAGDEALAAMLAAQRIVLEATPWTTAGSSRTASWCAFDAPGRRAKGQRTRQAPSDDYWSLNATEGANDKVAKVGRSLSASAAKYDDAIAVLDKALASLAAGTLAGTTRRSQANLRLLKYWFEASAFHLESMACACADVAKVRAPGAKLELSMSHTTSVRMSDCLDAWDKRVVPADHESADSPFRTEFDTDSQSNFLLLGEGHPFFRARREKGRPLANLDPRLRPRAERAIAAAAEVMKADARSAWGWVTYYSGLETFTLRASEPYKPGPYKPPPEPGTAPPPPPPEGPSTPGSGGGGSSTPK